MMAEGVTCRNNCSPSHHERRLRIIISSTTKRSRNNEGNVESSYWLEEVARRPTAIFCTGVERVKKEQVCLGFILPSISEEEQKGEGTRRMK